MKKNLFLIFVFSLIFLSCGTTSKNDEALYKKGESHYQLGIAALSRGDMLSAKRELNIAISILPEEAHYHNHLGIVYLNDKDFDKAEECFKKAIELDKTYTDPFNNLGVLYMQKKDLKKAREMFLRVLSDQIYAFPHYAETNLGIIERLEKNYQAAEKHFLRAIKISGKYCEAFKELGILYDEQGDSEKAKSYFVMAVEDCPYHVEALYRGAIKLLASKNEIKGKAYLARCLEAEESNLRGFEIPFLQECVNLAKQYGVTSADKNETVKKEVDGGY